MKPLPIVLAVALLGAGCHADALFKDPAGNGPTTLGFVTQPSTTPPGSTITPAVQVALLDSTGAPVASFTGQIVVTMGRDGSPLQNAALSGTTTVTAVRGVATFSNLAIDQIGVGYTLRAAPSTGGPSGQSAAFDVGPL